MQSALDSWPAAQHDSYPAICSCSPVDSLAAMVRTGNIGKKVILIKVRFHIGKRAKTEKARTGKAAAPKKAKVPKKGEKAASKDAEVEDAPATPPALEPRGRSMRERKPSAVPVRPLSTLSVACTCLTREYVITRCILLFCESMGVEALAHLLRPERPAV